MYEGKVALGSDLSLYFGEKTRTRLHMSEKSCKFAADL
jgi:hypothetical protein